MLLKRLIPLHYRYYRANDALFNFLDEFHQGVSVAQDETFSYRASDVVVATKMEVPVPLGVAGAEVRFEFRTDDGDIGFGVVMATYVDPDESQDDAGEVPEMNFRMLYVLFCYTVLPSFFSCSDVSVSVSLLSIYCCLLAFSNTTWHKSNHHSHPPIDHQPTQYSPYLSPYRYQERIVESGNPERPIGGKFTVDDAGVLFFLFNNEHDWIANKHVSYEIDVHSPCFTQPDAERRYVFCYTLVLPSFFSCMWRLCLSLIHLLLPACLPACII
jgi:hypothetical protein